MTPLLACFPVCLTFVGIAVVGLFAVLLMGTNRDGPNAPEDAAAPRVGTAGIASGVPPLWLAVLIFAAVFLHFALLLWLWPEL